MILTHGIDNIIISVGYRHISNFKTVFSSSMACTSLEVGVKECGWMIEVRLWQKNIFYHIDT